MQSLGHNLRIFLFHGKVILNSWDIQFFKIFEEISWNMPNFSQLHMLRPQPDLSSSTWSMGAIGKHETRFSIYLDEYHKGIVCEGASTPPLISKSSPSLLWSTPISWNPPSPHLTGKSVFPSFPYYQKCNCEIKFNKYYPCKTTFSTSIESTC